MLKLFQIERVANGGETVRSVAPHRTASYNGPIEVCSSVPCDLENNMATYGYDPIHVRSEDTHAARAYWKTPSAPPWYNGSSPN